MTANDRRILDDPSFIAQADPKGLGEIITRFPDQCREAASLVESISLVAGPVRQVLTIGMGGSAVGGDLLAGILYGRLGVPLHVCRSYRVPAWAGEETLAFVSSYSGNTEETLSAFAEAKGRGARIVVLTTGGKLGALAEAERLPWVKIPCGLPPRSALGYLLFPTLLLLERSGLVVISTEEIEEALGWLRTMAQELGPSVEEARNQAKEVAGALVGKLPVIYGAQDLTAAAAYRWKTQLQENSKVFAVAGALPEMNHNEIVGWGDPAVREFQVVVIRDRGEHPQVVKRFAITKEIIRRRAAGLTEVWARGEGPLSRGLTAVYFGDWVSYYLAVLRGVDPWPVEIIEELKGKLQNLVTENQILP